MIRARIYTAAPLAAIVGGWLLDAPVASARQAATAPTPAAPTSARPATPPVLVAPKPDASGRVPFGALHWGKSPPGSVAVTSELPGVQIFMDGRFFGWTPLRISQVPTGDYIVEAIFPDGRSVSRAISISDGLERRLEITRDVVRTPEVAGAGDTAAPRRGRLGTATWILGGVGLAAIVTGGVLGWQEMKKQDEYDRAPLATDADRRHLGEIAQEGRNLALLSNLALGGGAACLIAATILGVRDLRQPGADERSVPAAVLAPGPRGASWRASLILRF